MAIKGGPWVASFWTATYYQLVTTASLDQLQSALPDHYQVEGEIGAGGMATVYAALDTRHGRRVAIKVLRPELASALGPDRFLREITIAARLHHPHILSLIDSGAARGVFYYVMPLVDGISLRARLDREGELPLADGLRLLHEVLDALAFAHAQGIIHRDVKPENVMLAGYAPHRNARWHALVTDFGVAKAVGDAGTGSPMTATGIAMGTPSYMAPEQAAADPNVDHRADIYATGVLAHEIFAGTAPFTGPSAHQVIAAHMTRTPESLSSLRPAIPADLARLVSRALEKRPADRWQTANEMLDALEAVATPAAGRTATAAVTPSEPVDRSFRLSEAVCRTLDRAALDSSIIDGEMRYLDNQHRSDVLLYCIHGTGQDQSLFRNALTQLPYRVIAPTLVGFEPGARARPALALSAHIGLLRELLRASIAETEPARVVVVGFSAGGDVALRLVAGFADCPPVDGLISLGCNLSFETCFVTRVFMQLGSSDESAILEGLSHFGNSSASLDEWLKVHGYLVDTFNKFGRDVEPVRRFSADLVGLFETKGDQAFAELFREASARVPVVRCLWEESETNNRLVRELRLRNLDDPSILGEGYRGDSLVIEQPGVGHFELFEPDRLRPHVEAVLRQCRETVPN